MNRVVLLSAAVALLAGCPGTTQPPPGEELCGNGLDDNANGFKDCEDITCWKEPECAAFVDGGWFGTCAKCGRTCSKQQDCLATSFNLDDPLPQCLAGRCTALLDGIDVRFEVDTRAWVSVNPYPKSMNVRFVLKKAVDGTAVSCSTVQAVATSSLEQDASQIERTERFNFLSFDTTPIQGSGTVVGYLLPTGTGSNYLIWTEFWAGARDSNTKLPTGRRLQFLCVDSGAAVEPVLPEHHWPAGTPTSTSRTIRVVMPGP